MPRRPKKGKSSDLLLRKLMNKLDSTEASLLRERIVRICEMGKHDISINPEKYTHGFIAPEYLNSFYDKCIGALSYENKDSAEREPVKTPVPSPEVVSLVS